MVGEEALSRSGEGTGLGGCLAVSHTVADQGDGLGCSWRARAVGIAEQQEGHAAGGIVITSYSIHYTKLYE